LGPIRYKDPCGVDYCREYSLSSSWTSAENFVEIHGLDADWYAGPWGSREIDCKLGRVVLPDKIAAKMAAAILLAECREAAEYIDEPSGLFATPLIRRLAPNDEAIQAFTNLLEGILAEELAEVSANPGKGTR
jgi:hypothetical protein